MRIAFHAPLKPLDHPVPSGDRTVARLLVKALGVAGHVVVPTVDFRTWSATPDPARLAGLQRQAEAITADILAACEHGPAPDLWFTYHPYYKAPDLIGPAVAAARDIPYVTAEASHAPKRDRDGWAGWQAVVEQGLRQAALHFCATARDREGLAALLGPAARLIDLPPFRDEAEPVPTVSHAGDETIRLVTVGMMRSGNKLESYLFLARALEALADRRWSLAVIGDGPERAAVASAFARFGDRVRFHGEVEQQEAWRLLAAADLFVWPGIREAYGMSFLDAAAAGLPILATRDGGVPAVVAADASGLLTPPGDLPAFAAALVRLADDAPLRQRLGEGGKALVAGRTLAGAALILDDALRSLCRDESGA